MKSLEGANCADLPAFVIDKYFGPQNPYVKFHADVAKAICAKCVVLDECRENALNLPLKDLSGVIGGLGPGQWKDARDWRSYEQGLTDKVPQRPRPDWLPMTDAAHHVEEQRLSEDADEPKAEY